MSDDERHRSGEGENGAPAVETKTPIRAMRMIALSSDRAVQPKRPPGAVPRPASTPAPAAPRPEVRPSAPVPRPEVRSSAPPAAPLGGARSGLPLPGPVSPLAPPRVPTLPDDFPPPEDSSPDWSDEPTLVVAMVGKPNSAHVEDEDGDFEEHVEVEVEPVLTAGALASQAAVDEGLAITSFNAAAEEELTPVYLSREAIEASATSVSNAAPVPNVALAPEARIGDEASSVPVEPARTFQEGPPRRSPPPRDESSQLETSHRPKSIPPEPALAAVVATLADTEENLRLGVTSAGDSLEEVLVDEEALGVHLHLDSLEPDAPIEVAVESDPMPIEVEDTPISGAEQRLDRPPPPKRSSAKPQLPTAKVRKKPWWEEVFGDDFSRAYRGPSPSQLTTEVAFIEQSFGLGAGAVILDVACGQGEYAVELNRRGFSMVGYDLSVYQLAMAADRAQVAQQKINFLQGDMREMAFEGMFDGLLSWNTSFGYFEEEKNLDVARRMFNALKPGGVLVMEILNRDYAAREAPISNWYEGDGCICMDDMTLDFIASRLKVKRSVILDDGRSKEVTYSVRLYCLSEIGKLLHDVGFVIQSVSGSPTTPGAFLGGNSPSIIIRAERPLS